MTFAAVTRHRTAAMNCRNGRATASGSCREAVQAAPIGMRASRAAWASRQKAGTSGT
jgi:hypothetical protein